MFLLQDQVLVLAAEIHASKYQVILADLTFDLQQKPERTASQIRWVIPTGRKTPVMTSLLLFGIFHFPQSLLVFQLTGTLSEVRGPLTSSGFSGASCHRCNVQHGFRAGTSLYLGCFQGEIRERCASLPRSSVGPAPSQTGSQNTGWFWSEAGWEGSPSKHRLLVLQNRSAAERWKFTREESW